MEAASAVQWESRRCKPGEGEQCISPNFQARCRPPRPIFGAEPRELSLLFVLFYIAASGDEQKRGTFERNFNTRGGAQQSRFVGGSQLIPIRIATELGQPGYAGSPVYDGWPRDSASDVYSHQMAVSAKHAIVAVSRLPCPGRIDYEPLLPYERD